MKKIEQSWGLTDKKDQYNMLNSPSEKMSTHKGERLEIRAWAIIENTTDTGEVSYAFQVITTDGEYIGTNSKCFLDGVRMFLGIFEPNELTSFQVGVRANKQGREYITFIA